MNIKKRRLRQILLLLVGGILVWSALVYFRFSEASRPVIKKHPSVESADCSPFFQSPVGNTTRIALDPKEEFETDCESIFSRHYFPEGPLSDEEAEFPFAIARDYYFLEQMLALQYSPQNSYCFVLDGKADRYFKTSMRNLASCFPNVYVPKTEYDIDRFGHNMNMAHWECVKELRNVPWKYVYFMQNHDIPLKTNLETVRILKLFNGTNDVEVAAFGGGNRVSKKSRFTFESLNLFQDESRNTNETLKLAKGGIQSAFSRPAIDFLLSELNVENLLTELNKGRVFVDEAFTGTVQSDPTIALPGGTSRSCIDRGKKISSLAKNAVWYDAQRCKSGNMRHSVCVFGVEDLPNVISSPTSS
ncbi:hypothetical protein L596_014171 [Steinernema carpocapsae]|uniref:Uncharacterized protein n=1 Tax=Steinernema carpocapsae TaxID=34508 RepID=A0A4U5NB10_STECR|nr:hypothetical protein L596_014171 [Steinernema carpocapsae]